MILCVPTVKHTGTYFVGKHLLGWPEHPLKRLETPPDPSVVMGHLYPSKRRLWEHWLRLYPAIVPIRHPYVVERSWLGRVEDTRDMFAMWRELEWVDRFNPMYLPIDVPDREKYLQAINQRFGLNLTTDWPVINSKVGTDSLDVDHTAPTIEIRRLYDEMRWLFSRFYD